MKRRYLLLGLCFGLALGQWGGNTEKVLNEDGYAFRFNGEQGGFDPSVIGNDTVVFEGLNLSAFPSVTIEIWSRYTRIMGTGNTNSPPVRQPILYYGSDANNFLWISATDGVSGNFQTAANSLFGMRASGSTLREFSFKGFDFAEAWTHFVIALQPSSVGSSYVWGLGARGFGTPQPFNTNVTTAHIQGATTLTLGNAPASVLSALGNPGSYTGKIAEIRIWNRFIPVNTMNVTQFASLSGTEPGLIHWWKVTNTSNAIDRVGTNNGVLLGATVTRVFSDRRDMIPLFVFNRTINYDGASDFDLSFNDPDLNNPSFIYTNTPAFGQLCVVSNGTCIPLPAELEGNQFRARLAADRRSCGKFVDIAARVLANPIFTNSVQFNVQVNSVTGTTFTRADPVPTLGGTFRIEGTGLGLSGPLASDEFIQLQLPSGTVQCTSPTALSTQLTCVAPPGVGSYPFSVRICGVTYNPNNLRFAYRAPTIESVVSTNFQAIAVSGANFGPARYFDNSTDSVVVYNSSGTFRCSAATFNDSVINCDLSSVLENGNNYTVSIRIGGQNASLDFNFQICNPVCQNGGRCLDTRQCSCFSTGFEGAYCQIPIPCQPECKNGGICVRSGGTSTNETGTCQCPGEFAGTPDCSAVKESSGANVGPIVGGVVGGAALILVISIVVIVLIFKRREKREGANFIPLEKKDFTKIIYGDQLNQTPDKSAGNLKELEKLLVEDKDLAVSFAVSAVTQITEADKIAKAMIVVFQDNNKVINLLEAFISEEVRTTESSGTLFRANSMVSKMFKFYSRLIGLPYLYVTIGPELGKLIEEELGLEVDPEKMEEGKDLDEMRWALMSQSQKILKQILISDDKCPAQFRVLFAHIAKCVGSRFPDNVNTTIGGFIFLRLFCPAVSSPEAYGIVEEPPSPDSRRLLILITKVMQNLSNDVEFGSKEPYMTKMNDFIQSNRLKLITFYEKLLKPPTKPPVPCELPKNIKALSLVVLAQHIRDNLEKIEDPQIKSKLQAVLPPE